MPPDFHNRHGKISILSIAENYFDIPETLVTWGFSLLPYSDVMVAKSLSSSFTSTNQVLFTSPVNPWQLDPDYPWYLQEKIEAIADTTVFVCGSNLFCFDRDRSNLQGVDWRAEQDFSGQSEEWILNDLSPKDEVGIRLFCRDLGIDWGRIDFLRTKENKLIFLEYNANGQWVFLD